MQRICATIDDDQIALLERVARERRTSVSGVLRTAIDVWARKVPTVHPGRPVPEMVLPDNVEAI